MSYRIPVATLAAISDGDASSDGEEDDNEWVSSVGPGRQTKSLFDETIFPSPEETLKYDEDKYGFALRDVGARLGLDVYGRMRLVNWIRKIVGQLY